MERAQEVLDSLDSGIDLVTVLLTDATEPLAIRAQFRDVQKAREEAKEVMDRASQAVATEFTRVAGEQAYSDLLKLINQYSLALTTGDQAQADQVMAKIGERFEAPDIGGDAAQIINRAKAYQSRLETRLVSELRKLRTLSPTFRENPRSSPADSGFRPIVTCSTTISLKSFRCLSILRRSTCPSRVPRT